MYSGIGAAMIFVVWLPGIVYLLQACWSKTVSLEELKIAILFPILLIYYGLGSLGSRFWANHAVKMKERYIELKKFEVVWEAMLQVILTNILRIIIIFMKCDVSFMNNLSYILSNLTLFIGVFHLTKSTEDQQNNIALTALGRIFLTFTATNLSFFSFFVTLAVIDGYLCFIESTPMHLEFTLAIPRFIVGIIYGSTELVYLFSKTKPRVLSPDQLQGWSKIKFWIVQPMFVNMEGIWMYVAFLFSKPMTVVLYLGFFIIRATSQNYETELDTRLDLFGDVMHLVVITNVGQESAMLVMVTVLMFKPNLFFHQRHLLRESENTEMRMVPSETDVERTGVLDLLQAEAPKAPEHLPTSIEVDREQSFNTMRGSSIIHDNETAQASAGISSDDPLSFLTDFQEYYSHMNQQKTSKIDIFKIWKEQKKVSSDL